MVSCDALMLGCSGAGKTVLIRQLRVLLAERRGGRVGAKQAAAERAAFSLETAPTVGVEIHKLAVCGGGGGSGSGVGSGIGGGGSQEARQLRLREVGAPMAATWQRFVRDARMVVFVVDLARGEQLAAAAVELLELLAFGSSNGSGSKNGGSRLPLALWLNKSDVQHAASREDIAAVLRLGDLAQPCLAPLPLPVFRGSAATGEGCAELLAWIEATKRELLCTEAAASA